MEKSEAVSERITGEISSVTVNALEPVLLIMLSVSLTTPISTIMVDSPSFEKLGLLKAAAKSVAENSERVTVPAVVRLNFPAFEMVKVVRLTGF